MDQGSLHLVDLEDPSEPTELPRLRPAPCIARSAPILIGPGYLEQEPFSLRAGRASCVGLPRVTRAPRPGKGPRPRRSPNRRPGSAATASATSPWRPLRGPARGVVAALGVVGRQ